MPADERVPFLVFLIGLFALAAVAIALRSHQAGEAASPAPMEYAAAQSAPCGAEAADEQPEIPIITAFGPRPAPGPVVAQEPRGPRSPDEPEIPIITAFGPRTPVAQQMPPGPPSPEQLAVRWLHEHQAEDGSFSPDGFVALGIAHGRDGVYADAAGNSSYGFGDYRLTDLVTALTASALALYGDYYDDKAARRALRWILAPDRCRFPPTIPFEPDATTDLHASMGMFTQVAMTQAVISWAAMSGMHLATAAAKAQCGLLARASDATVAALPRATYSACRRLSQHPRGHTMTQDPLVIGGRTFSSRLLIGTGKFPSPESLRECIDRSGSEIVTVALRRVDLRAPVDPTLSAIPTDRVQLLPNTSGARDADEAVRLAQLARKLSDNNWVKLEVTPDPVSLLPDPIETLRAAEILVKDNFIVLPYCHADLILARRLEAVGCATVMPLGSPIGTNRGIRMKDIIGMIIESLTVPVIVDAGIGVPSHACEAMEMGAAAVLVNTALATADDPGEMGLAFADAVRAGRRAFLAGPGAVSQTARASSPLTGFLDQ